MPGRSHGSQPDNGLTLVFGVTGDCFSCLAAGSCSASTSSVSSAPAPSNCAHEEKSGERVGVGQEWLYVGLRGTHHEHGFDRGVVRGACFHVLGVGAGGGGMHASPEAGSARIVII